MRLWLKESERRPDPAPARADGRKALLVGTLGWLAALALTLVFRAQLEATGLAWLVWAAVSGVTLGVLGLVVVQVARRRIRRHRVGSAG